MYLHRMDTSLIESLIDFLIVPISIGGSFLVAKYEVGKAKKTQLKQNTFELWNQYQAIRAERIEAYKRLNAVRKSDKSETIHTLKDDNIFTVFHFWDSLRLLKENGLIDEELTIGLFKQDYNHFHPVFEAVLTDRIGPSKTQNITRRICELRNYFPAGTKEN